MNPPVASTLPSGSSVRVIGGAPVAHGRRRDPGPRGRIVQLGRFLNAVDGVTELVKNVAARHEHLAIRQQDGRVAVSVPLGHPPGGGPGPAVGVVQLAPWLPVTSTVPSRSNVAVAPLVGEIIFPVAVQVPLAGSYTSAPRFQRASSSAFGSSPSPTSTLPSRSNVAGKPAAGLDHVLGGRPGPGGRVVQLRGGVVLIAVGATRRRAPGRRGAARRWSLRGVPIEPVAIQAPARSGTADGVGSGDSRAGHRTWSHDARKAGAGIGARRRARTGRSRTQHRERAPQRLPPRRKWLWTRPADAFDGSRPGVGAEPAGWRRSWDGRPPRRERPPPSPPTARRSRRTLGAAPRIGLEPRHVIHRQAPIEGGQAIGPVERVYLRELMCRARASSVESNPAT